MIDLFELSKKIHYPPPLPKLRLMKSQTELPVNIVDVFYSECLEFGILSGIETQCDANDELNEENTEIILFTENAETLSELWGSPQKLPDEILLQMKDYVKKSYGDKESTLFKLLEKRKAEWQKSARPDPQ